MTETASHPWSIFLRFLLLGCVSFGGPAAHIGYFRERFVEREKWLDDAAYGRLVALSQFLPGPGSSQVGFALGYRRAGILGALAAFLGFTLPSFVLAVIDSPGLDHPAGGAVLARIRCRGARRARYGMGGAGAVRAARPAVARRRADAAHGRCRRPALVVGGYGMMGQSAASVT